MFDLCSSIEHRAVLRKVGEASVDVDVLCVDVIELGAVVCAEVIEQLSNLRCVGHGSSMRIGPIFRYQVLGAWPRGDWRCGGGGGAGDGGAGRGGERKYII